MKVFTSEVEMLRAECKEWEKVCEQHLRYIDKLKKQLKKALANHIPDTTKMVAQPEQEPVAWLDEYGNAFPLAAKQYSVVGKHWKPLYTTPPQRTWVGLTDEEVNWFGWHGSGIRTIEAKLKEKNT